MKKLFVLFVALFTVVVVAGCNGEREFAADGEFTAYEIGTHSNAPMVTMVTVTIEDDEIVSYYIDARQGKATQSAGEDTPDDTSDDEYTFSWNAETKKELGDDYNMVQFGGAIAEWYEQAALIEAYWLENGVDSVTVDADNVIDNVAGVTIKDGGYTDLAAEAVQLAKDGKMQAVYCSTSGTDLYIATMTVDAEGNFSDLLLDTQQAERNKVTFTWKADTKQELGYDYKMHYNTYSATDDTPTMEEYKTWLTENDKLEWFEQVALITDDITENGWEDNTAVDAPAGVTITKDSYYTVLGLLFDCLPE